MTKRVYLHVGAPKSGTTYIQQVLEDNRARLHDAGVRVVGDKHLDRVHAAMVVREDPRLEALPEAARTSWERLVKQIHGWRGDVAILSYELFAGASAEQVAAALADLAGLEVHVVITARDLGASVPSAWQERLKFALTTPLEEWRPRPERAGVRAEWGWRTLDPAGVAARWGAGAGARPRPHRHRAPGPRRPVGALAPVRRGLRPRRARAWCWRWSAPTSPSAWPPPSSCAASTRRSGTRSPATASRLAGCATRSRTASWPRWAGSPSA